MNNPLESRRSGLLLHPSSLPDDGPIGTAGGAAREFVDLLSRTGQSFWQMLPLTPVDGTGSPYGSDSAMAMSPWLADIDDIQRDGLVSTSSAPPCGGFTVRLDYARVRQRECWLKAALRAHRSSWRGGLEAAYQSFLRGAAEWLPDYALFAALHSAHADRPWYEWPEALAKRDPDALSGARERMAGEIEAICLIQFAVARQWEALKTYANARGVSLVGDIPIYVVPDSADVWANQQFFQLDRTGRPTSVSGVPPDAFSDTGQRWGGALYDWDRLAEADYAWWVLRFTRAFEQCDVVRIDHFRGFESYWSIPASDDSAVGGEWVQGPGRAIFDAAEREMGCLPIIAEDLGIITEEVEALRDSMSFPGMKILQFAFDSDDANPYLPHNHVRSSVVYPGTHDNDTTVSWYSGLADWPRSRLAALAPDVEDRPAQALIGMAWESVCNTAIATIQDILGLGEEGRMNTPATTEGNWSWRLAPDTFGQIDEAWLTELTRASGRWPE